MSFSPQLLAAMAMRKTATAEDKSVVASTAKTTTTPVTTTAVSKHRQEREAQKVREMTILPKDFEPSDTDVVIGRGKRARTHGGNQRLRGLIEFMIPEYSAAGSNKDEKSYIIKEIVTQIRKSSPDGGFVKFDKSKNRWYEVGDFLAREKISQTFRDAMGDSYSSSNPYKRKRRSFEKKHNAILDIIKRRRGSSPTSVLQSGASSPSSPNTPEPALVAAAEAANQTIPKRPSVVASTTAGASPPISPPQAAPAMLDNMAMFSKRPGPGQIGFARRSMLHFGLPAAGAAPPTAVAAPMFAHHHQPNMAAFRMRPSMPPIHRPVPHHLAPLAPRRSSLPINPALFTSADLLQRQAAAAALFRRPSQI
ncbi:Nitrilase family, member 2 [Seminavis robusta]|uniref:Nitrilase family, member 2 n=1 Tax=Seminavis robusta TaxID=568900 RepID=A0A9N8HH72_9STRA|nr:Nitrilase family, member 2 [Seminavis robusta]|eukprot:Sro688_g187350.1 Nitrilase family, member 2 (365) ;mRNA; r:10480-11672